MKRPIIEIYESDKGGSEPHRWRLRSGNNQILLPQEGYYSRSNVRRAIARCRWALVFAKIVYVKKS